MCQSPNSEVVPLPDHIAPWKESRTVSLDRCIVEEIKAVWAAGFETLGCCCEHGKKIGPSLVVGEGYSSAEVEEIGAVLKQVDARPWTIFQWKLTAVAGEGT